MLTQRNKLCRIVIFLSIFQSLVALGLSQTSARPTLTVATEPAATVFVDDIRFGRTNAEGKISIKGLSIGRHTIRVRADGYKEALRATLTNQGDIRVPLLKTTDAAELAFQEAERLASQDLEKAGLAYRKAIGLRPGYAAAYIGLARVLSDNADYDGALKAIRDLRRTSPQNAEATAVEGRIYRDSGDDTKAIAAFRRSILQGHGFQPEAYTGLGLIYKEKAEGSGTSGNFADEASNYGEAAKNLSLALKQLSSAPDAVVLYQLLGLVYEQQKRYKEAIALYTRFLELFPDSNDAPAIRSFIEQIKKEMP